MIRPARICGLHDFGLALAELVALRDRQVSVTIHQRGIPLDELLPLTPKERRRKLRSHLRQGLRAIEQVWPGNKLLARAQSSNPWIVDGVLLAQHVPTVLRLPQIEEVLINSVKGLRRRRPRRRLGWYCVWGKVAIQVEGRTKGLLEVEDRLLLVKAFDHTDAEHRLAIEWEEYAEPYLNPFGEFVRWKLIAIEDVYALPDDDIAPRGTEVFSKLSSRRMKPAYEWHPSRDGV